MPDRPRAVLRRRSCISVVRRPAGSHNAHNLETVTVYYRWHPLYGLVLPVWRRIKYQDGQRIYCKAPDGRICALPGWMLRRECAQFCIGSPLVSLEALAQLYDLLRDLKRSGSEDKGFLKRSRKEGSHEASSKPGGAAEESVVAGPARRDHSGRQARRTHPSTDGAADQRGSEHDRTR